MLIYTNLLRTISIFLTITFSTARHQTIAGNEIRAEQSHRPAIKIPALFGVILEGYVIGLVIAQYLSVSANKESVELVIEYGHN